MAEVVTILSANLARVRPVGMSDDAAHEWLTVCATDVVHLSPSTLRLAASEAAKTVTHHGQIIPAILASSAVADERKFKALNWAGREGDWERRKTELTHTPAQKLIANAAKGCRA